MNIQARKRVGFAAALTLALAAPALQPVALGGAALAQTSAAEEPVYGSQLMTQQERLQYRDRLRQAQSEQERQRIREEHHRQMQARARERGVTLPDQPPAQGMHRGQGMGMGQGGMGSGGPGMGQGGMGPGGGGRGPGGPAR